MKNNFMTQWARWAKVLVFSWDGFRADIGVILDGVTMLGLTIFRITIRMVLIATLPISSAVLAAVSLHNDSHLNEDDDLIIAMREDHSNFMPDD